MTERNKKIIEDAEKLGIPIFVLTAKDRCSTEAIRAYKAICSGEGCPTSFLVEIQERIYDFDDYQSNPSNLVKLPD